MGIGKRIKEAREAKGYTQGELAALLNIAKGSIGNYEAGISHPKEEILYKLFKVLEVDANFLYQDMLTKNNTEIQLLPPDVLEVAIAYKNSSREMKKGVRRFLGIEDTEFSGELAIQTKKIT